MSRHYSDPALLIEFEIDRPFGLLAASEVPSYIDPTNVLGRFWTLCFVFFLVRFSNLFCAQKKKQKKHTVRLALLVLHFPRLRLFWCRSPHATAKLFLRLKGPRDDPDPERAAALEKNSRAAAGRAGAYVACFSGFFSVFLLIDCSFSTIKKKLINIYSHCSHAAPLLPQLQKK
jgi:DNA excision repair protein ERCC-4